MNDFIYVVCFAWLTTVFAVTITLLIKTGFEQQYYKSLFLAAFLVTLFSLWRVLRSTRATG